MSVSLCVKMSEGTEVFCTAPCPANAGGASATSVAKKRIETTMSELEMCTDEIDVDACAEAPNSSNPQHIKQRITTDNTPSPPSSPDARKATSGFPTPFLI